MELPLEHEFLLEVQWTVRLEDEWSYWMIPYNLHFQTEYPNHQVDYDTFAQHFRRLIEYFHDTKTVCKGKFWRVRFVLTEVALEDEKKYILQAISQQ